MDSLQHVMIQHVICDPHIIVFVDHSSYHSVTFLSGTTWSCKDPPVVSCVAAMAYAELLPVAAGFVPGIESLTLETDTE